MSTRGVIARATRAQSWRGIYHHWDSYPEGLGAVLWKLLHTKFAGDVRAMLKVLIDDHPAGWSTVHGSWDLEPGYLDDRSEKDTPPPQCYCHGDRSEPPAPLLTKKTAVVCGCEYAYVFDEKKRTMAVQSSYCQNGRKMIGMFGMGDPQATWTTLVTVDLSGPEPDWSKIK